MGGFPSLPGQPTATMLGVDPVATCVAAYKRGEPDRVSEKTAVKLLTQLLVAKAPGNSVEVRVPPYSAVQILEGVRHRRAPLRPRLNAPRKSSSNSSLER